MSIEFHIETPTQRQKIFLENNYPDAIESAFKKLDGQLHIMMKALIVDFIESLILDPKFENSIYSDEYMATLFSKKLAEVGISFVKDIENEQT
jgi:hypothetical protein